MGRKYRDQKWILDKQPQVILLGDKPFHILQMRKERLREVKLSPEVEQERNLCLCHGEKLMLFCEEDREVICWLCARSQEHHGHHTFLMEEVAQKYQVRDQNGGKTSQKWYLRGNVYFALDFDYMLTMNLGLVISFLHMLTF